ncbi:MAG: 1-acyl-sn-glycerol-3-phosphate acyltransferase, partial [Deltaproteobacteria bacterium]|nr:1-acyl-sn-glycerol-3-phosphate acyltransferase [Deltaproteobacteria bacterium]
FSREDLEVHAGGVISTIFGDQFTVQDAYARQVRMPEPPLLLADRVIGIDAEPGSMGTGTIWTETDVREDSWYLHQGHIPQGVCIEAGQADLMLISWLGVDFTNRGERVYRLLGCELTLHGPLPSPGETLQYAIHLDGHAAQGDIRLMFFHYDGFVDGVRRISVRQGQAGFFTDAELADSDGCLWTPEGQEIVANPRLAEPVVACTKTSFTPAEVRAFTDGRPWECFGPGFERTRTHTRTPRIQGGRMLFLDNGVDELALRGGPWGRGYLKASVDITPDKWFFDGHFKNDPCMPGTLMFDGCLQAMSFFLASMGFTTDSDGYRFEPTHDEPMQLHCRGQVTPTSKRLTYEVFVEEVVGGPSPILYADLLCTVDGLKAFHARRVGLRLVPGWPLDEGSALLLPENTGEAGILPPTDEPPVAVIDGFRFDQRSLVACANGRPSQAFGPMYTPFDGTTRVARLPNPPYLFISRASETVGPIGSMQQGLGVTMEYDIPSTAWYFDENGCRVMPYAVLLEAALQPCGWLASYTGCALTSDKELFFRNLDGTSTLHVDLLPTAGTLRTVVKNTGISKMGPMIIVNYAVECFVDDVLVYDMTTVFGFFPAEALANQVGLPTSPEQRAALEGPSSFHVDLRSRPATYWAEGRPHLAEPMLLMIDRVTGYEADGGDAGLGTARAEKDVDVGEWFFKAHFFGDPVQPGSLGIEAMIQLLQWTMLEQGMDEGISEPRFESIGTGQPMTWKYRGQVIPTNKVIGTTLEITERGQDDKGPFLIASASLWVDGKRIYEASGMGMRIVSGGTTAKPPKVLDPASDTWLLDHCPTYTKPALPMMSMVDLLASAAPIADPVIGLRNVKVTGWLDVSERTEVHVQRHGTQAHLIVDDRVMASAQVLTGEYRPRPEALPPLDGPELASPYDTGALFHGPAFQVVERLVRTSEGASSILRATSGVPLGVLNQALLDGATHGIPHDALHLWDENLPADKVAYPALITELDVYGPTPTEGTLRCEVRPDGHFGTADFPAFRVQLIDDSGVWCSFRLVEACFPKGRLGSAEPRERRTFLRDFGFVAGLSLSTPDGEATVLDPADVVGADWLPGTVEGVYGTSEPAAIAEREHLARTHEVHPGRLPAALPLTSFDLDTQVTDDSVRVTGDARGTLDISSVKAFWDRWFDAGRWPVEDLYYGLIERFVGRVVVTNPKAFEDIRGRSAVFLANHQTGVESLIFSVVASGLTDVPTVTLAKIEHQTTWLGRLIAHCFNYPNVRDPKLITFFDRTDKASLPAVMGELAGEMAKGGRSVMVHVEGTRSLQCRTPVQKMSGGFIDMALAVGAPVIPVRFVGGLPSTPLETRLEFPLGMGTQDIWFGEPLLPEELSAMHYGARKQRVIDAINGLGPSSDVEEPHSGDAAFAEVVEQWQTSHDVDHEHATLRSILAECAEPTDATKRLLAAASADALPDATPEDQWLRELATRLLG